MPGNNSTADWGTFEEVIKNYIHYKRALGYKADGRYLRQYLHLGTSLSKHSVSSPPTLTSDMVEDYIFHNAEEVKFSTIRNRMSIIRQLALFMNLSNPGNYVFPNDTGKKIHKEDFVPHIFTKEEVGKLDLEFQRLKKQGVSPLKVFVFPMLFRLLYCTGLRLGEALNLKLEDVDIDDGILLIRKPKNKRDRLVPMSITLWEEMKRYYSHMHFDKGYTQFLFPTRWGSNYRCGSITRTFKQVYKKCNIYNAQGNLPRIHDLRHTFCTHALEQMVERGVDVCCALPYLCEYVGHRDISSTNAYLRLLPEKFSSISAQLEEYCPALIPEVMHE